MIDALRRLGASVAVALAIPAGAAGSPGYAIDGLRIKPPMGAFGGTQMGSCDLRTYEGCRIRTFTLENVGSDVILIGGYGIFDADPSTAALVPGTPGSECAFLPLIDGYWGLAAGDTCTIGVAFDAGRQGRVENELHVWHTSQFSPIAIIPLFGVGT